MIRDMRSILCLVLACATLAAQESRIRRENIEWTDVWFPNSNDSNLPRVLLIGDSITRGYYSAVETNLKGKAYCARIATSKAIGDPALAAQLTTLIPEARFDVVHFNIGMHGWAYSEDEYRQHLPELLAAIRKSAPDAKLIWASTTPVRVDKSPGPANVRIVERNRIAREFFGRQGVAIDDLYAAIRDHADLHSDDVHFKPEGSAILAAQVAASVEKALGGK